MQSSNNSQSSVHQQPAEHLNMQSTTYIDGIGLILYEITNCKRQILTWIKIGRYDKNKSNSDIDNFKGWCQSSLFSSIVIDAHKIYNHAPEYLSTILKKSGHEKLLSF